MQNRRQSLAATSQNSPLLPSKPAKPPSKNAFLAEYLSTLSQQDDLYDFFINEALQRGLYSTASRHQNSVKVSRQQNFSSVTAPTPQPKLQGKAKFSFSKTTLEQAQPRAIRELARQEASQVV